MLGDLFTGVIIFGYFALALGLSIPLSIVVECVKAKIEEHKYKKQQQIYDILRDRSWSSISKIIRAE